MNWSWNQWMDYFFTGSMLTRVIAAFLILWIGLWISGVVGRAITRGLAKTNVDQKSTRYFKEGKVSSGTGLAVKYFLALLTILMVLQLLNFTSILNPFVGFINVLTLYIPNVLAAGLLAVIAHIIGTMVKSLIYSLLSNRKLQEKANQLVSYRDGLAKIGYALVILLFAPAILGALQIQAIAGPIGNVIALIINYLPLVIGAVLILAIGHFIAKFVANLVESLLTPFRLERWTGAGVQAAHVIGSIVYFLIIFPIAVQALNLLNIASIQKPAEGILNLIMAWIPKIAIAAFLIYIGYILAKIVRNLAITLISPLNVNQKMQMLFPAKEKDTTVPGFSTPDVQETSPAIQLETYPITRWIANLVGILVFGFFLVEATNILNLAFISTTVGYLIALLPRLVLVVIIIIVGKALALLAERMISDSNPIKRFVSPLILILAFVIGLTEIGLASIIITSGFMIILGALAVTFIISVGIGSIPAVKTYWAEKQNKPRL
ncbi:hypothetical protein J2Z66_002020 [Paenibacillus eucommiae]|uniref:Uncharacterized protein n=1 Tax=Paenibacillus eucommiae TaxID=1355755 RepID=A0ABS4IS62_9BACL|nr:mechanosensitive ion channel [Paenibacillus eucommiae]MBP1990414.1 hypothetical protein [Paenibacillus eucommiae]